MAASGLNGTSSDSLSDLREASGPRAHSEVGLYPAGIPAPGFQPKASILVVDDDHFVREGLVRLINRQPDLFCCGQADSIAATPSAVASQRPDLVLLDLQLKDGESLALIKSLKAQVPETAVLVLSQGDELLFAEKTLRAGARGYVMKQEAVDEILAAIRAVLLGRIYVSRDIAGRLLHKLLPASSAP